MITSGLLLGAAALVLLLQPRPAARLSSLVPRPRGESPGVSVTRAPAPVFAVLGLLAWWLLQGWLGAGLGLALTVGGPRLITFLDAREDQTAEQLEAQLPLALDLLGACLAGGGSLSHGLTVVASAVGGPCGVRFDRVAAALAVGTPAQEAFSELGEAGASGSAARALCRAAEGGTPVAGAVSQVAAEARRRAALAARQRARRAGVQAAAPLSVCFLPAFLVLSTIPSLVALAGPLLHAL